MSLADLISTFNNVRRKKNLDRTFSSLYEVFSMLEENGGSGSNNVRSGVPVTPVRASITLESLSGNNSIVITYSIAGVAGNSVTLVVDDSSGPVNRPLSIAFSTSFNGTNGSFIVLTMATDETGDISISNTWGAVGLLSGEEHFSITSNIGDGDELFEALGGPLEGGQNGSVGDQGDIYLGEGNFYISTQESTVSDSFWKQVKLVEEDDLSTQNVTMFTVLQPGNNSYRNAREINFITQGSLAYQALHFAMTSGTHGERVKLTWFDNIGPDTTPVLYCGNGEGVREIRDASGSAQLSDLMFNISSVGDAWVELEYEVTPSTQYWKLIASKGLLYTPKNIIGAQTACIVFSDTSPTFDLLIGECPNIHVEIYDHGIPTEHSHSFTLANGTIPRQRCHLKVVDVPMLSNNGILSITSNNIYTQSEGGPILLVPRFTTNLSYLLLEWEYMEDRWMVIENDGVASLD